MRILLSSDKFKGALSAQGVAQSCEKALQSVFPGAVFDACPIADGGEGTTEAMVAALRGVWRETTVLDAQARPRRSGSGPWSRRSASPPKIEPIKPTHTAAKSVRTTGPNPFISIAISR